MAITDPCVIRLLAEGGAIEIFGHKDHDGSWLFIGRSMTLSIEDDGNDSVSVSGIPYFRDLSEALPDNFWIKLTPSLVHPELRGWFRDHYEAAKATLPDVRCGGEEDKIEAMLWESRLGKWQRLFDSTPPDRWSDEESFLLSVLVIPHASGAASMYDEDAESDECEKITCPHCGTDSNNECPHLLMLYDVTFCQCEGGVAFDHQERFQSQVLAAFTRLLTEGAKPKWSHFEVGEVWDGVLEEGVEDPEDIDVRGKPFLDLMASVLEAAGGGEYPGSLVSGSGAYCESSVRLLYAEDPEQVCKDAEKVLEEWLKPEEPKPKKSRKRK